MRTTVTILCENTAVTSGKLLGEHGLSFLVERGRDRLLFDTGQGQTLARNAATLGKDLSTVQRGLLSHGHYDHSGGLGGVLTERGLNTVYGLPGLFRDRYALHETSEGIRTRFIGMSLSQEQIESHGAAVDLSEKFREVLPGMYASGRVERPKGWQGLDARLVVPSPSGFDPDPFDDDCSLLLETDAGPVLLLGCAHAGLPAIFRHVTAQAGIDRLHAVIGGTHLGAGGETQWEEAEQLFQRYQVQKIVPNHCTGFYAAAYLNQRLPGRVFPGPAGTVFMF